MYGVGARLDHQPELFFRLRKVDHLELIEEAVSSAGAGKKAAPGKKTLAAAEVADVFGIELAGAEAPVEAPAVTGPAAKAKRGKAGKTKPVAEVAPPAPKPASKPRRSPKARKSKDG
jgi:hypothetical protein